MAERNRFIEFDKKIGYAQILSIIAIVLSIIMPILTSMMTYGYFLPRSEEVKKRPELLVSNPEQGGESHKSIRFEVTNIGKFPANDLQVIILASDINRFLKDDEKTSLRSYVRIEPALEADIKREESIVRLTLKGALGPKGKLIIIVEDDPKSISLINQYGDLISIYKSASGGSMF